MTKKARAILAIVLGLFFLTQIFAISAYFVGIGSTTGWWAYIYAILLLLGTLAVCMIFALVLLWIIKWVDNGK